MSISPRVLKASALLMSGAALGGAGGYAATASGASPAKTKAHAAKRAAGRSGDRLRRAVSITAVVPDGHGAFATLTIERGTLESVSGDTLTVKEGTKRATYKTVTVTLPSSAEVRLSGAPSTLSQLTPGDRVEVLQGPRRSAVIARQAGPSSVTNSSE